MKVLYGLCGVAITLFLICITLSDYSKTAAMESEAKTVKQEGQIKETGGMKVRFTKHSWMIVTKKCVDGYWYLVSSQGYIEQMMERDGNFTIPIECRE